MKLHRIPLEGARLIELEPHRDERGSFARTFCRRELAAEGLETEIVQCNISYNARRGTLRGMHYQVEPHGEAKLVACVQGAVHDVIVDMRPDSPTYLGWYGVDLSPGSGRQLYVPVGFAHGFITLTDDALVHYTMFAEYVPAASTGVRWDDPAIGIRWPAEPAVLSERDRDLPAVGTAGFRHAMMGPAKPDSGGP